MNYRHGYHAGNFADVVKHIALVAILLHLRKKDTAFAVIDSHAGRGAYDLAGEQAAKTGEAQAGIARLADLSGEMPEALSTYLSLARESAAYPGSPLIAAKLLRPQDRLTAIEKHPEEFAVLKKHLAPFRNAQCRTGRRLCAELKLLPPPSRRGLVLIDPPFEAPDEFSLLAQTLREAYAQIRHRHLSGLVSHQVAAPRPMPSPAKCWRAASTKALAIDTSDSGAGRQAGRAGSAGDQSPLWV